MMISASQEDLYAIAFRAIEAHKAKNEVIHAKHQYHQAWKAYEIGDDYDPELDDYYYIDREDRICANHPLFEKACAATKQWHDAYKDKKRVENNAKRRLETAIRRIA